MNIFTSTMQRSVSLFLLLVFVAAAVGEDAAKKKDRANSHIIEARRLAAEYKLDKAADKARDALKDDANLAEAHVYLGEERFRANDLKMAESEYKRALELDPYQAAAHCHLGYLLYQQGQLDEAADQWALSRRLDSTSPLTLAGLALSQFKGGQEDQGYRTYEKALMYDRRFLDPQFLESEKGPKLSGRLLHDFRELLAKLPKSDRM